MNKPGIKKKSTLKERIKKPDFVEEESNSVQNEICGKWIQSMELYEDKSKKRIGSLLLGSPKKTQISKRNKKMSL